MSLQVTLGFQTAADELHHVDGDVIDLTQTNVHNYYHFITEYLVKCGDTSIIIAFTHNRLLLSHQYFVVQGHAPHARHLLPDRVGKCFSVSLLTHHSPSSDTAGT